MALPAGVRTTHTWLQPLYNWLNGITANTIDTNASHIAKVGVTAAAGSQGKAADSGHTHQLGETSQRIVCTVGHNGAGAITASGLKVNDKVMAVANLTDHSNLVVGTDVEATVTVVDQLQQSSATNLSAKTLLIVVASRS